MRQPARALPGRFALVAALLAAGLALALISTARAEEPPAADEISFDGVGTVLTSGDTGPLPVELVIQNFSSRGLSVRWAPAAVPVPFCTVQSNRPASISAEQFREAVRLAVEMWNDVEAAVGVRYTGDCPTFRVDMDNERNEIGWDDARNQVTGSQAGVTQGAWTSTFGRRDFAETDILLDSRLSVPEACFRTVVAHELGHAIGFGHSDARGDLMYPSFSSSDLSTCRATASDDEERWLVNLYGQNLRPTITPPGDRTVLAGAPVTLSVLATDPDGDPLTYEWTQTAGTPAALTVNGNAVSLTAPASGAVTLRVSALDRYLHRSSATFTLRTTTQAQRAPGPPSLQAIAANRARGVSTLTWGLVDGVQSHEFCVTQAGATTCTAQAASVAEVAWATTLPSGGRVDERTVLALDMRATGLRACNSAGCSTPGTGPLMGGLRWTNWGIGYDVVAMAFDVPGTSLRFTIGGVVNLGLSPRRFALYTGPEEDPQRTLIRDCGLLDPGQTCIGFLGSSQHGHGEYAVVESSGVGTPVAVHRVRIR